MKRVLIISPYFPPSNAADMQRVRMTLPFLPEFGWEAEVVTVNQTHSDINKDTLLLESVPKNTIIHQVEAFSKKLTSRLGLGSIALRSLWFYKRKVDDILTKRKFDLIYFSTTQFPVCILGRYWKQKFNIPYIIDMQDPWHSEYYQDKPQNERPPKYWFSSRLNKFLEPVAMKTVDGLISVSNAYIKTLKNRYPEIIDVPSSTITFGAFYKDFEIAENHLKELKPAFEKKEGQLSIVYVGRGGADMQPAVKLFFEAFKQGLDEQPEVFSLFKIHFIGTSYAAAGAGKQTLQPIANELGLDVFVKERTDRIPFYQTINTLKFADLLFIPGSDDPQYTASKIYPYLMAKKPLVSIFHPQSSAARIIRECESGLSLTFDMTSEEICSSIKNYLISIATNTMEVKPPIERVFENYSARNMTRYQVELFEQVLNQVTKA